MSGEAVPEAVTGDALLYACGAGGAFNGALDAAFVALGSRVLTCERVGELDVAGTGALGVTPDP